MAMSEILNPKFPLTGEELRIKISTFAAGNSGSRARELIKAGSNCERKADGKQCGNKAIASIEGDLGASEVNVLTCEPCVVPLFISFGEGLRKASPNHEPSLSINGHGRS